MKTPKSKPLTADDLKSLVQALGGLVRESVRDEVRDALKDLERRLEARGLMLPVVRATERLSAEEHAKRMNEANTPASRFSAVHDALEDGVITGAQARKLLDIGEPIETATNGVVPQ